MKVESESEVPQSSLTLSDPMDCSLPGSSIHGIFQATVLEWGAISLLPKNGQMKIKITNKQLPTNKVREDQIWIYAEDMQCGKFYEVIEFNIIF